MASLKEIAAMKFNAIFQNGSRLKDYVDISCLLILIPLQKLLIAYEQEYPDVSGAIAQKALVYFEDIDFSVPLEYMPKFNLKWREIKSQLDKAAQQPNNTIQINQKKYGMNRIRARLKNTNQSWIASVILVLNLVKLAGVALACLGFSAGPKQPCNSNRMAVSLQ
nr:hypothetical protein [Algoriphagus resistens]